MSEPISVLVVDDDFMVARIHQRYVDAVPGFRVAGVVHTGAEAQAALTSLDPDLVLLDLYLPDIDVADLLAAMLADDVRAEVIVLSAANDLATVRAAFHGGAAHYLVKPFGREDLVARLQEWRRRREVIDQTLSGDGALAQSGVDQLFGRRTPTATDKPLPKGLAGPTLAKVVDALADPGTDDGALSATECGERVGIARVSARRYLEHLVATGAAVVEHRYGSGRPERRYRVG